MGTELRDGRLVVIDVLTQLGRAMITERVINYRIAESSSALWAAAGEDTLDVLKKISPTYIHSGWWPRAQFVIYGIHPASPKLPGYRDSRGPPDHEGISNPLQLAAFFAVFGMKDEAALELRYLDEQDAKATDNGKIRLYSERTLLVPDYSELGLKKRAMRARDSIWLRGAFTTGSYQKLVRSLAQNLSDLVDLAVISASRKEWPDPAIQDIAYDMASRILVNTGTSNFYYDAATSIQLCTAAAAADALQGRNGVARVAGLYRSDCDSTFMKGLYTLASLGKGPQDIVIQRMSRGPRVDELLKIRHLGVIGMIDRMPWEFIEPIHNDPALIGRALPWAESAGPTLLRRFLTDHVGRLKRLPSLEHDPETYGYSLRRLSNSSPMEWEYVMSKLHDRWKASRELRSKLLELTGSYEISFLALESYDKDHGAKVALQQHPNYDAIKAITDGFVLPEVGSIW